MKISDNNHKILQTCTNNLPKAVRKVQYRRVKSYTNNQTNVINATTSIFLLLLIISGIFSQPPQFRDFPTQIRKIRVAQ